MSAYATAILLQGDNEHVSPWNVKFMFLISNYFFIFPKRVQMEYKIPSDKGLFNHYFFPARIGKRDKKGSTSL